MMSKKPIYSIVLILILFLNCSEGSRTYHDNEYGFSFDYPSDWKVANESIHHQVLIYEPVKDTVNQVATNISVVVKSNHDIPLNIRAELIEQEWDDSNQYKNFEILEKRDGIFQNEKAVYYKCQANVEDFPVMWRKVILIIDDSFYDISMTTTKNKFDEKNLVFNDFLNSFSLDYSKN
ncbi:hypothetical protein FOT42_017565 [Flagellimonas hadalis]|uniref:PsbP C-terminal domain-containing protein n=2 Tax=Flagellimonas hadalis TaxID=2597517 RepID=A0A5N5IQ01_9FLAO|nr:hypothetical protein FOT42_017565 [Allomuricauda hadalis]